MADLAYTDAKAITDLVGQLAVDLRTDDVEAAEFLDEAIDHGSSEIDFYSQGKYVASDLAANRWVKDAATAFAVEKLCMRRLNAIPESAVAWADRYREKLQGVLDGKWNIPGCSRTRRAVTVTNQHVDLRRPNNQVRTDTTRSTGVAKNYNRPTDPTAPDSR